MPELLYQPSSIGAAGAGAAPGNAARLVAEVALRTPDAPAVLAEDAELSYAELDARAEHLAARLRAAGVGPESLVGVLLPRGAGLPLALVGTWKAAGAYLPVDPGYPAARIAGILAEAAPRVVLTDARSAHLVPAGVPQLLLDPAEAPPEPLEPVAPGAVDPAGAAYVIFTSGSTGRPKGVVVPHQGIELVVAEMRRVFALDQDDRVLLHLSPSFDASVFEMLLAFSAGCALHVPPEERSLGGELADYLREQQVTAAVLPPSLLATIPPVAPPALRTLLAAGEALRPSLLRQWSVPGRRFFNAYGPTEATIWSTIFLTRPDGEDPVPIGEGLHGVPVSIRDEQGETVPDGEPGELHIGGRVLARGYLGRPGLTASRFVPDPDRPGARAYRTGDLTRRRPDGEIEYLGRVDRQVKIRGYRIELDEIENVLAAHPAIAQVSVVTHAPAPELLELAAYLVFGDGHRCAPAEVRAYAAERLPDYMLPASWTVLDALPFGANGKVDRAALPAPDRAAAEDAPEAVEPRDDLEQMLADLWGEVLGRSRVRAFDDFLSLGGNSLTASVMINRLEGEYGLRVPLLTLFQRPVLADFATALFELEQAS